MGDEDEEEAQGPSFIKSGRRAAKGKKGEKTSPAKGAAGK